MNYFRTGLLLAGLTGLFLAVGYLVGGMSGMVIALGLAIATNAFAYWNSDKMVLRMYGARPVDAASAPEFHGLIQRLAANAGLPMPRVYLIDSDQPNAFATGRNPENAAVAATTGLLRRLSADEVAGVMAHELAHVKNRDTLTMTVTATIAGAISMLASEAPGRLAGYAAIVSSGILLSVVGYGQASLIAAGLFYLLGSTMAIAAFMLLIELIERVRTPGSTLLAVTMEAFGIEDAPGEPVGVGIPGSLAFLGLGFAGCAMAIAGIPPLTGFVGKFALFHALLQPGPAEAGISPVTWILGGLIIASGMAAIISFMRFGVRTLWAQGAVVPPRLLVSEAAQITFLLLLCVTITVAAGPVFAYLGRTADTLHQPAGYVERVLGTTTVSGPLVPAKAGAGR